VLIASVLALASFDVSAQVVPVKFTATVGHAYHVQFNSSLNRFWQDSVVVTNQAGQGRERIRAARVRLR